LSDIFIYDVQHPQHPTAIAETGPFIQFLSRFTTV